MERKQFAADPCSIARSLDVLGDWWVPLIIRECLYGARRFEDLQRGLGIGRNILTRRLNQLVEQGVLERRPYQEGQGRHGYHLTEKGYDAARVVVAMMPFGEKWLFGGQTEPTRLYDRETGRRVRPILVDEATGAPLDPRSIYPGPGPSFPEDESLREERFAEYYSRSGDTRDEEPEEPRWDPGVD